MDVGQAEARLRELLEAAGLDCDQLDPSETWTVFRRFAAEAVGGAGPDPDDDMCLFQCGVYDWADGKGPRFYWDVVRQFMLYDASGEYDHMEQLHCELQFEATPELREVGVPGIWSGPDLDEWAREVEQQEGFTAVAGRMPEESRVYQEEV